ncbi:MAG: hypothetical protein JRD68_13080, partial [Deltaproteobacteria bacterium]|nr:hypothetical protein [Deltaproteobacteria bacterium]
MLILITFLSLLVIFNQRIQPTLANYGAEPDIIKPLPALPKLSPGLFQDKLDRFTETRVVRATIEKNQTFGGVLGGLGLDNFQVHELTQAIGRVLDLRKVRPGAEIVLRLKGDNRLPVRLDFCQNHSQQAIVVKTLTGYAATLKRYEPLVCLEVASGEIKLSLW